MLTRIGKVVPNEYSFRVAESGDLYGIYGSSQTLLGSGRFREEQISRIFGSSLDEVLADWLEIAFSLYWADRLAPRRDRTNQYHDGQRGRRLNLAIPVRQPAIWIRPTVYESLRNLLTYFTEDEWVIDFTQYKASRRAAELQGFLFQMTSSGPFNVSLFSGGLDSFAGTIGQIDDSLEDNFVLVSGTNNNRKQHQQSLQYEIISRRYNRNIRQLTIPYWFHRNEETCRREHLERSRGFLFLSLGAATAIAVGGGELCVYENGVGAVNLPYDGTQLGISSTRAVNPIALSRMGKFITELIGHPFAIKNPYLFETKAELCKHQAVASLGRYIGETFSCDGFPMRISDRSAVTHCGSCTSCLLRRTSLEAAGLSARDSSTMYLRDLTSSSYRGRAKDLRALRAMEWQVFRIKKCLREEDSWRALSQEFPELIDVLSEDMSGDLNQPTEQAFVRLYSQYVEEWESFSARRLLTLNSAAA